jgi:hypothetical protein
VGWWSVRARIREPAGRRCSTPAGRCAGARAAGKRAAVVKHPVAAERPARYRSAAGADDVRGALEDRLGVRPGGRERGRLARGAQQCATPAGGADAVGGQRDDGRRAVPRAAGSVPGGEVEVGAAVGVNEGRRVDVAVAGAVAAADRSVGRVDHPVAARQDAPISERALRSGGGRSRLTVRAGAGRRRARWAPTGCRSTTPARCRTPCRRSSSSPGRWTGLPGTGYRSSTRSTRSPWTAPSGPGTTRTRGSDQGTRPDTPARTSAFRPRRPWDRASVLLHWVVVGCSRAAVAARRGTRAGGSDRPSPVWSGRTSDTRKRPAPSASRRGGRAGRDFTVRSRAGDLPVVAHCGRTPAETDPLACLGSGTRAPLHEAVTSLAIGVPSVDLGR